MEKVEITNLINKIYDAVDESKAGPLVASRSGDAITWNTVPYQILLQFIGSELPHLNVTSVTQTGNLDMKLEEPGSEWKK